MKILAQDRKTITDVSKELWATRWGENEYAVLNKGYSGKPLGLYATEDRSLEIVAEIFDNITSGNATYKMPEK